MFSLGRRGKPTTRLVGVGDGRVAAPRVYIAGGGDTLRVETGEDCSGARVSVAAPRTEGLSSPLPLEMAEVEVSMARDGPLTSRGRETLDVFLSTVTMVA